MSALPPRLCASLTPRKKLLLPQKRERTQQAFLLPFKLAR
jgi:hypothetical protein